MASAGNGYQLFGQVERAIRWDFDPQTEKWSKAAVNVVLDSVPFAQGSLRNAHRMQLVGNDGSRVNYVAKMAIDPLEQRDTYFRDVQAQIVSKTWAAEYNKRKPPKLIDFVNCFVLELATRPGRPLLGVELFVEGVFQKHNSNVGGTCCEERNTPNAFSHFTWEASGNKILVCDIQGVGDVYTDPQVHTVNGQGFGRGNLGMTGIKAFLMRHQCNVICEYLHLPQPQRESGRDPPLIRSGTPLPLTSEEEEFSNDSGSDIISDENDIRKFDRAEMDDRQAAARPRSTKRGGGTPKRGGGTPKARDVTDLDESDEMMMQSILNDIDI